MKTEGWDIEIYLEGWNNGREKEKICLYFKERQMEKLFVCLFTFPLT